MVKLDPDEEAALKEALDIVEKAHADLQGEVEVEVLRQRLGRINELLIVVQV